MTATTDPVEFMQLWEPGTRADPYPLYTRLRELGTARLGSAPIVAVSSYDTCEAVLRDPRTSSDHSRAAMPINRLHMRHGDRRDVVGSSFLFLDPPDQTRLRRLVSSAFTPRTIERLEDRVRDLVDAAIDRIADGPSDLVADLAYPLPVSVICALLGVPAEDEVRFRGWSSVLARALDPITPSDGDPQAELEAVAHAEAELVDYFEDLIEHRRTRPGPDLLSDLIRIEDAGDTLTHKELIATCGLLLIAGHETTVNLIANGVLALLRNPEVLHRLHTNPSLGAGTVEETLRYDPPVQLMPRIATEPIDLGPVRAVEGDTLVLLLAAAHRDPDQYPEPDTFDPTRQGRNLAFGMGAHFCLGAPLARLEGRLALTRFAQRLVQPRLHADPPPYKANATLRGPAALHIDVTDVRPATLPW